MKKYILPVVASVILALMWLYIPDGFWKCIAFYLAGGTYIVIDNWNTLMADKLEEKHDDDSR
jgi:hypothetical protein